MILTTVEDLSQHLHNDDQGRRSIKSIVGQIAESWINSRIQVKIYNTMLLHSKKEQIIIIGKRLLKTESGYNKEQDAITLNKEGHQQTKRSVVL